VCLLTFPPEHGVFRPTVRRRTPATGLIRTAKCCERVGQSPPTVRWPCQGPGCHVLPSRQQVVALMMEHRLAAHSNPVRYMASLTVDDWLRDIGATPFLDPGSKEPVVRGPAQAWTLSR